MDMTANPMWMNLGAFALVYVVEALGGSFVNVALIGVVDVIARPGLVLDEAGAFPALAALLGIVVIGRFMAGLAERADRTRLRMGIDSMLVLTTYFIGMFLPFQLRGGED